MTECPESIDPRPVLPADDPQKRPLPWQSHPHMNQNLQNSPEEVRCGAEDQLPF